MANNTLILGNLAASGSLYSQQGLVFGQFTDSTNFEVDSFIESASGELSYNHSTDSFSFNQNVNITGSLSITGITDVSASIAAAGGSGGSDNLGDHTATQDLDLANFDITNITTASVDRLEVNNKLQGNGSGFQFFAFNEDTSKVKFANWFTDTDNQYGMGMLWYETWFAAIDTDGNANDHNRRIGFYLEQPEAGATDSTSGETGRHPNNARFYVDITGSYVASGGLHVTDANFDVESDGNVSVGGSMDLTAHITASGNISSSGELIGIIDGGSF